MDIVSVGVPVWLYADVLEFVAKRCRERSAAVRRGAPPQSNAPEDEWDAFWVETGLTETRRAVDPHVWKLLVAIAKMKGAPISTGDLAAVLVVSKKGVAAAVGQLGSSLKALGWDPHIKPFTKGWNTTSRCWEYVMRPAVAQRVVELAKSPASGN